MSLLATVPADEVAAAVGWLVGEPPSAPLGMGPAQLWELKRTEAAAAPSMSLRDVESALDLAKQEPHAGRLERVASLVATLTTTERSFFVGSLTGSLRQGSLGGVMLLAIAERAGLAEEATRRVVLLRGSVPAAAGALLGPDGCAVPTSAIEIFRPVAPMLAAPADSVAEALAGLGDVQVEWKIDGVRAQIHKKGSRVAIYSRQGHDITEGCRPLLEALARLPAETLVLDGEVALVGPDGIARAFQDSFSAIASKGSLFVDGVLRVFLFDCLHVEGEDLLDAPLATRLEALHRVIPHVSGGPTGEALVVPSARASSAEVAERFYADALAAGNEGVVVKDLIAPYRFGARGRAWQKVKEHTTVDLVVLAAEWGSGRRKGFLSNLHLGARRGDGSFCMIGKTFKGLTDEMLRWQTARLEELATTREGHVVYVRPELVVEVRFNDVQRSPRYPGGIALRFARVVRHRDDKAARDVEPLSSLVARAPAPGPRAQKRASPEKPPAKRRQLSLFDEASIRPR